MESYIFHNCGIFLPNLFIYPVKILSTETYNFPYFPLNNICVLKKLSFFVFKLLAEQAGLQWTFHSALFTSPKITVKK